jgi:hypothetical protein
MLIKRVLQAWSSREPHSTVSPAYQGDIYASRNKINIYSCVHVRAYMHIET